MVSVLIPSRERPAMLQDSIMSLGDDVEILVYVDDDDPQLVAYTTVRHPNMTLIIGKRHTYHKLHYYYNTLAKLATQDWLMVWNDDAEMLTKDWTKHLHKPINPEVINFDENPQNNLFPLISRQMYEVMGHYLIKFNNRI